MITTPSPQVRHRASDFAGALGVNPGRIGAMTAAALVILQLEHHRTA